MIPCQRAMKATRDRTTFTKAIQTTMANAKLPSSTNNPTISWKIVFKTFIRNLYPTFTVEFDPDGFLQSETESSASAR
jgi:hypothetical protein